MAESTDVIVLGVGTCGEDAALRLLAAGLEVTGIEARLVGGECAYWACLPTKSMIRSANLLQEARRADGLIGRVDVSPDWSLVAGRVRSEITGSWDDAPAVARFEGRGGTLVRGRGRLTGYKTVAVNDREFEARRGIVIATGSVPAIPPIPGLAQLEYWTTRDAIGAESLPSSLLVLGGGPVGCELGQVFSRFGVDVTIVEGQNRLLGGEEPEASAAVMAAFEAEGIGIRTGVHVISVDSDTGGVVATLDDNSTLSAERLLIATGRHVELGGLGLDAAGIDDSGRFIEVDAHLRAGAGVWAIGDVTGKGMLTHVALYQGTIAVADILGNGPPAASYDALPRGTFTDPEVGSVGLTEEQARNAGLDVQVVTKDLKATFRGWLHRSGNDGLIKLVADRQKGILVGATAVGPHGAEVLGMLSVAVRTRAPLHQLVDMIYAFPTFHGGVGEALGAYGRGLTRVLDPGSQPMFDD
ncbi:MAG: NAD(P)/FAD-dependent oxidoreductase [Actinobacteria bacterium]|nr:MAG: NAD(P)/FAD-dependent oxidoreductase [Actinomycetota bacterium]